MADSTAGARPETELVRLPKGRTALVIGTRSGMGTAIGTTRTGAYVPGAAHLAPDAGGFDAPELLMGYVRRCAPARRGALDRLPSESSPPPSVARPSALPRSGLADRARRRARTRNAGLNGVRYAGGVGDRRAGRRLALLEVLVGVDPRRTDTDGNRRRTTAGRTDPG
jgi:hypothetical protein